MKITRIEYADTVLWALLLLQQSERDQTIRNFVEFLKAVSLPRYRYSMQDAVDYHRIFEHRLNCHEMTMACRAIAKRAALHATGEAA